ncbi:uncharacterized protein CG7065-like [Achroia grisella]|uniref:uncharacterized protein CG7065-like n=1 Tax=Achroia grisella TaxID=688607 RepID=UPI0027D29969|nr:uncharacterized protein CG7065-like [Achroia grisella]
MELPDCPPGAEGYQDSVVEVAKKPEIDDKCTKAEQEFQDHLNSLKIEVENGTKQCMVQRRGRDISGKWIYLCFPCAVICSGEPVLQTHLSGKKHKNKLINQTRPWPLSIFTEHPYVRNENGTGKQHAVSEEVIQKLSDEVDYHNRKLSDLDIKYEKYRNVQCHIQDNLDSIKVPLLGVEYLVEHPPEEVHHEPSYICTLCSKQGHPRTIVNHLTCYSHRFNYISLHFPKAHLLLVRFRGQTDYREAVSVILHRLSLCIQDKYGRLKPVHIDKQEYEKEKDLIHQWIFKGEHITEKPGCTFEEVVDTDLIHSIAQGQSTRNDRVFDKRDPSPPVVAAPTKPNYRGRKVATQQGNSDLSLSDISPPNEERTFRRDNNDVYEKKRYEPYPDRRRDRPSHSRGFSPTCGEKKPRPSNYEHKVKITVQMCEKVEESAKKILVYHEKNPEKHPLYPEEWKKFWNKRYKEIQAEGKDPSKHDFKPEWILYWTNRMKELHDEEVKLQVNELYRRMCLTPPGFSRKSPESQKLQDNRRSPDFRGKSPDLRRKLPDLRRKSPDPRRKSPEFRRKSPIPRRRTPDRRRRSPDPRPYDPRRRSPETRRRTPDYRRELRSPDGRRPPPRRTPERRRSPHARSPVHRGRSPARMHMRPEPRRSRSPLSRRDAVVPLRNRSPVSRQPQSEHERKHSRGRSPARTHIRLESTRRSRSPLSRRDDVQPLRNRSPAARPHLAPSMQTVLVSDDELRPDDGISPWNSDNDIESLGSVSEVRSVRRRSRDGSEISRGSRSRHSAHSVATGGARHDLGPVENVVATLRLLVALEDYLGSLGPKILDLLTDALKMEKEKANSSEDLLDRESAVVLIETAKEKLKGASQAGLVAAAAAGAVRAAIVRAAATLHVADKRARRRDQKKPEVKAPEAVPVAGIGEVNREEIAQQMAAALIAQGKTDVSSEELAQLVDAVVGMAEAKKRESNKNFEQTNISAKPKYSSSLQSGTASALQMLQSAYDENDKKTEKEDVPDAMDGLSDSDLETLLKNFNDLSAEEQHSLIAYLKKLEAREPQRVERLRQYVSAAAAVDTVEGVTHKQNDDKLVTIESDDDDYTVEEVFQSATQKVKEDQIRQEMEIVKKSIEESKEPIQEKPSTTPVAVVDLTKNISSATDLLALVQASIQSTTTQVPAVTSQVADVVASSQQPRSFGDLPEPPLVSLESIASNPETPSQNSVAKPLPSLLLNFMNASTTNVPQNDSWNNASMQVGRDSTIQDRGPMGQINRGPLFQDNRGPMTQESRGPMVQESRGLMAQESRGPMVMDNRGPMMQDNRGPMMQDNRDSMMQDNRGPTMQDKRGPIMQDNRGPMMQDNRGPSMQSNRGPMIQDNRGPMMQDNRGPMMQDNRGSMMQDSRGPTMQSNRGPMMQDNRGPMFQSNRDPMMQDNRGPQMRGTGYGNFDSESDFNQGLPRGNFNNMQNNYDKQFGEQKNFRGRGGGRGPRRGRGRGYY